MLRVKEICKQQNITLTELAERLNVSQESLSRQIHGNPTIVSLQKIADALNVPVTDLFPKSDNYITGYIEKNGRIYKISSSNDLNKFRDK
jgi:transcriptional regulator with XRE-family HTH domain